jgi:hypothetical protein
VLHVDQDPYVVFGVVSGTRVVMPHMIARASTVLHVDQDPYVVFGVACPVRAW